MISPDPLGILEKFLRGKQDEIVSWKQMVLPTENHFHHVVCYDRKLRNRPLGGGGILKTRFGQWRNSWFSVFYTKVDIFK